MNRLCETNDTCFNAEYDFNASGAIDANDQYHFVSNYYMEERPLLESKGGVIVTDCSAPPIDSQHGKYCFYRGIQGLQNGY